MDMIRDEMMNFLAYISLFLAGEGGDMGCRFSLRTEYVMKQE